MYFIEKTWAAIEEDWPEPEPCYLDHVGRHLRGDLPLPPYDGSRCDKRPWKKAIDGSIMHRCTCPSCGMVRYVGDWQHHVELSNLSPCDCARPGALPDWRIRCPPGCTRSRKPLATECQIYANQTT
jgi:hypothetical protein